MVSVLLIGHISNDLRGGKLLVGGPPRFQLPIFQNFDDMDIHVITSCTADDIFLQNDDIEIDNVASKENTTFQFMIDRTLRSQDKRKLILRSRANDLNDISHLLHEKYDIAIISPIAGELSKETMELVSSISAKSYFDIQGIVRQFKPDGEVYHSMSDELFQWALKHFDVIKCSKSELPNGFNTNSFDSKLVITNSGLDILVISEDEKITVTSEYIEDIIDDTGAGDIFLGSLAAFSIGENFLEAIQHADKVAKLSLRILGVPTSQNFVDIQKL